MALTVIILNCLISDTVPILVHELCAKELAVNNICISDEDQLPIEILIGTNVVEKLPTGEYKMLPSDLTVVKTRLVWTLMRHMPQLSTEDIASFAVTSMLSTEDSISELWSQDTFGLTDMQKQ